MQNCSSGHCTVENSYKQILGELSSKTGDECCFDVCFSNAKGKHIHSKLNIPNNTNFFMEVPFISWPIKYSCDSLNELIFCENCLKIRNKYNFDSFLNLNEFGLNKRICSTYCLKKTLGRDINSDDASGSLNNGWAIYLQGLTGIEILRRYQHFVDPEGNIPITAEAISRLIAQIAADIHFFWMELGYGKENLRTAFRLGCKTIDNFISPPETLFPEINMKSLTECIKAVLLDPIKAAFMDSDIPNILLSERTIQQLLGQLTLNSQGIEVWDLCNNLFNNEKEYGKPGSESCILVIKGACICTIQSCFNHSCQPNCCVYSMGDSTVYISTIRDINEGEELTISYIDNTLSFPERKELINNYHFECSCSVCLTQGELNVEKF
ncbi:SET domain containing protein with a cysteine cluster at the C-terminus [Cryptosporidium ryanae]|uniref:SET domain containing protein with a cysteine cluster at the C-terminus n=1 Tax=Cryptosporidium ryanae TaxID=515981 RepID=UPI00351A32B5|nr:SET domain containing protein with a cysteine cluster at the C-terminus [Cryptosporidium ryanae]